MYHNYYPFYGTEVLRYGLSLVTPPASEPVTLAEIKTHCRVDISTDDSYLSALITAARNHVENVLGRRIVTQTWDMTMDRFPLGLRDMRMPWGPWQSITSIKYVDLNGTTQTWNPSNYNLDNASFEPRIYLSWAMIYPVPRPIQNAVTIRYVAGFTTIPENIKHGIKMLVDHWYTNARGATDGNKLQSTPHGFDMLIGAERQSII